MYFKTKYFYVYCGTFNYLAIQIITKPCDLIDVTTSHTEWWYIPEEHSTALTTTLPLPPNHLHQPYSLAPHY